MLSSAPITATRPDWFDWITVVALALGPVLALFSQRFLDWFREKKNRRVNLYLTAMAYRGMWLHPDSVRALNAIDTVFDKNNDKKVRDAWTAVIAQATIPRPPIADQAGTRAWDQRLLDLRVDLYQLLGAAVGYKHTVAYIKNQSYVPQYYVDAEFELLQIRKGFVKLITDDGLKVVVREQR